MKTATLWIAAVTLASAALAKPQYWTTDDYTTDDWRTERTTWRSWTTDSPTWRWDTTTGRWWDSTTGRWDDSTTWRWETTTGRWWDSTTGRWWDSTTGRWWDSTTGRWWDSTTRGWDSTYWTTTWEPTPTWGSDVFWRLRQVLEQSNVLDWDFRQKIDNMVKYVDIAQSDDNVMGSMARSVIKMELIQLKASVLDRLQDRMNWVFSDIDYDLRFRNYTAMAEKSLHHDLEAHYLAGELVRNAIAALRERITVYLQKIDETKKQIAASAGEAKELAKQRLSELQAQLSKTINELKDKILGRGNEEELEQETYVADGAVRTAVGILREKITAYLEKIAEAKRQLEASAGEAKELAKARLKELHQQLTQTLQSLKDTILGKKSSKEIEEVVQSR